MTLNVADLNGTPRLLHAVSVVVLDATSTDARTVLCVYERHDDAAAALYASGLAGCVQDVEVHHAA